LIGDGKAPAIGVKFLRDGQAMLRLLAKPKMTAFFCESLMRFVSVN